MLSLPILLAATFIAPSLGGYRVQNDLCNYQRYSSEIQIWKEHNYMVPLALMVTDDELFQSPVKYNPPILSKCQKALSKDVLFHKNEKGRPNCYGKVKKFTIGQSQLNASGLCEPCTSYQNQIIKCRDEEMFRFMETKFPRAQIKRFKKILNKIRGYTGLTLRTNQISFKKGGKYMCEYQPRDKKNPVCHMCKWENFYPSNMLWGDYEDRPHRFDLKPSFLHINDTELYDNAFSNVTHNLVCMKNYEKIIRNPDKEVDPEVRKECPHMYRFIRGQAELNHHGICKECDQKLNEMIKCRFKAFYKKVRTVYTAKQKKLFDLYLSQIRGRNQPTKAQMANMTNWLYPEYFIDYYGKRHDFSRG